MLEGQSVLVVGGGSGIGYAVAEGLVAAGAKVTVASRDASRVQAAAQRLGEGTQGEALDLTEAAAVAAFFDGRAFDHVITTAGDWGGPRGVALADLDLGEAASVFKVRFWGALALAKHAAPTLPPHGSITFTDGMIAHRPRKGSAVSTAMAGAVEHLTRALAVELAPIRVNCVCPAMIRTGVWDAMISADRQEGYFAQATGRQPIPRIGEPSEVAEAYLYLLRAGYTTGQVLKVDGGSALG